MDTKADKTNTIDNKQAALDAIKGAHCDKIDTFTPIRDTETGGERPYFASHRLHLTNVTVHAGESALKCCSDIVADHCCFEGKYPFWHVDNFEVDKCLFKPGARAALWYSRNLTMTDTLVEAPKMFREMDNLVLENVNIPDAEETLWHCRGVKLRHVAVAKADYLFMHSENIDIQNYKQQGNYSFQYCRNVVIRDAVIDSKDAFWNTQDVTVYDSVLTGEYLGWHSHNLRLVNCRISGTQPLCYCHNLILENCSFDADADLAFEDSDLHATVVGNITSVKNPRTGSIVAAGYGTIIIDKNLLAPGDCEILTR